MSNPQSQFPVRVYYEDTDFSGNVYHAAYLKFMERARTEFLRARNVHHSILAKDKLAFVVRRMDISFERPAHIDDQLQIKTILQSMTGVRLKLVQTILRGAQTLVQANVEIAIIGPTGAPARLPKKVRAQLTD